MVDSVDQSVGRILDTLDELGELDNTIVVLPRTTVAPLRRRPGRNPFVLQSIRARTGATGLGA